MQEIVNGLDTSGYISIGACLIAVIAAIVSQISKEAFKEDECKE